MNADEIVKAATAAMNRGDLDLAEQLTDALLMKVRKAAADEEDDEYDDPSNPSMDADDDSDEDDDSVDKYLRTLRKGGNRGLNFDTNTDHVTDRGRGHTNMGPTEIDEEHSPETYQLSTTAPISGQQTRHKFLDKVQRIQQEEKCGATTAMQRARQRHPELARSYAQHTDAQSSPNRAAARGLDKRAPDTFESLCADEIRKSAGSLTHEMAAVRVGQQFGFRAFDNRMFAKTAETIQKRFEREVFKIYDADSSLTLEEATRQARYENPTLFKALQVV
jgi:hypothetical protein